jgi:ABC-type transport system involved in Fe-S cluster assembly fused permease/ATPase subunit
MNSADNHAATKVVDSLLNIETVKYFGNETHETRQYDQYLSRYESAAIKTAQSLTVLNIGQNAVFSIGMTLLMWMTTNGISAGNSFLC